MQGNHFSSQSPSNICSPLFAAIHKKNWSFVLDMLQKDSSQAAEMDKSYFAYNWSILDHAVFQGRSDIIYELNKMHDLMGWVHPSQINRIILRKDWGTLFAVLNCHFYGINFTHYYSGTLLNWVLETHGNGPLVENLRETYGAKTQAEMASEYINWVSSHFAAWDPFTTRQVLIFAGPSTQPLKIEKPKDKKNDIDVLNPVGIKGLDPENKAPVFNEELHPERYGIIGSSRNKV